MHSMATLAHDEYLQVVGDFLAHWALVDAALAPGVGLSVQGGIYRPGMISLEAELRGNRTALRGKEQAGRIASADLGQKRATLARWLVIFNETVRVWWRDRVESGRLPSVPSETAAVEHQMAAVREALALWTRLNAGPPPGGVPLPLLIGPAPGLDRAGMAALLAGVITARDAAESAGWDAGLLRAEREVTEARLRAVLSSYDGAVFTRMGSTSPLARTVPRYSPLPGHTPGAVALAGAWEAESNAAKLEWDASTDPALLHYEIRACPGRTYGGKRERVVQKVAIDAARIALVPQDRAAVSYKVYVVLRSGNERGSKAATVLRPQ